MDFHVKLGTAEHRCSYNVHFSSAHVLFYEYEHFAWLQILAVLWLFYIFAPNRITANMVPDNKYGLHGDMNFSFAY